MATKRYSEEDVQLALRAITFGKMSMHKAARLFSVPRSTLGGRILKGDFEPVRKGPATVLTEDEELRLGEWIVCCWSTGFSGCLEPVISRTARALFNRSGRKARFTNFGRSWFEGYLKRHPHVVAMGGMQKFTQHQADWNFDEVLLRSWFKRVAGFVAAAAGGLPEALLQPARIFHCSRGQFGAFGVMLTYGADGRATPPLLILPPGEEKLPPPGLPKGWAEFRQKDGEVLSFYLQKVLQPFLKHAAVEFPVLVFLDHQTDPPSFELYEVCQELDVVLVNLYRMAFRGLRHSWQKPMKAWHAKTPTEKQTTSSFIESLKSALVFNLTKSGIQQAFETAGIFPFQLSSVDTSCFLQSVATSTKDAAEEAAPVVEHTSAICAPTQETVDSPDPYAFVLDFAEFKRIIGSEQLLQLQELDRLAPSLAEYSQEFMALHRIYERFKSTENVAKIENLTSEEEHSYDCLAEGDGFEEFLLEP